MFGRLVKYDFRSMFKQFGFIWPAALALALVNHFTINGLDSTSTVGETTAGISMLVYVAILMAMFIVALVFAIQRFFKGLLGDEGYLMHTLPVRPWQLIGANSNRLAAEFVLEIFKIIRGYGGSAICATQDINDFFALEDGKYGKGIINNAKTKILLNLEDEEARRVQSLLHLSEAEVMEITHFERGSGLISTNNNNVTVEIKCSQMEKELITTDRRELQELLNRGGGRKAG